MYDDDPTMSLPDLKTVKEFKRDINDYFDYNYTFYKSSVFDVMDILPHLGDNFFVDNDVNFHIISSKFVIEFSNSSGFRYVLCRENVLIFLHIGTGEYFL